MQKNTRKLGKLALTFVFLSLAAACGGSILDPQTENADGPGETDCFIINGAWVCRP